MAAAAYHDHLSSKTHCQISPPLSIGAHLDDRGLEKGTMVEGRGERGLAVLGHLSSQHQPPSLGQGVLHVRRHLMQHTRYIRDIQDKAWDVQDVHQLRQLDIKDGDYDR